MHEIGFRWPRDAGKVAAEISTFQKACKEFESQENMQSLKKVLALILAVGNYLNGGSPRGLAYGVKLDVLKKLKNLKANASGTGTLMNVIAHEAYVHAKDVLTFGDKWNYIGLAAELSLNQLETDVKLLEREIGKAKSELDLAKKQNGKASSALVARIESFLFPYEKQMAEIKDNLANTSKSVDKIISRFGDKCKADDFGDEEGEVVKAFFTLMTDFARSLKAANVENGFERAKAAVISTDQTESKITGGRSDGGRGKSNATGGATDQKDNLFGSFQKFQGAGVSATDLISAFKARFKNANREEDEDEPDNEW